MSALVPLKKQKTLHGDDFYLYQSGSVEDKGVKNAVVEEGIQRIDDYAFEKCHSLVHVSIPDSVTCIGKNAFYFCYKLKTIAIPEGVKTIEKETFTYCKALESIRLPNSITSIGEHAFRDCESLRNIAIPKGVREIGARAFMGSMIEEFVVPNGIKVIPWRVFRYCELLQKVELPSSIEEICPVAFDGCYKLENFVLPNGLPKLTKLNLESSHFGVHGFDLISQLIVNSPNLEELSLNNVGITPWAESETKILNDDDIPMLLQLVSLCPSLRTLNVSDNSFTPKMFETLASHNIPGHLRRLSMYRDYYYQDYDSWWRGDKISATNALLRLLKANPKLGIWMDKFWPDSEDPNVRHHLEMNKYGCRGFMVPDSLCPLLIERLVALETEEEAALGIEEQKQFFWYGRPPAAMKEIETGAPNILYPLLRRHAELFLRRREKNVLTCTDSE